MALVALQERRTISELAVQFGVHPTQIHHWMKQLSAEAAELFRDGRSAKADGVSAAEQAEFYEQIGRLKMELEWLKKKPPLSHSALRALVDPAAAIGVRRQCELLGLPPSTYYYPVAKTSPENLALLRLIDEEFLRLGA